jgi:minor extracellular serine protease Vpr
LNAIVEWIDGVATQEKRPVVISCSFGGHYLSHDENLVQERELSARLAPDRSGRALVIAAGNEREMALHAKVAVNGDAAPGYLSWDAGTKSTRFEIFVSAPATFQGKDLRLVPLRLWVPAATQDNSAPSDNGTWSETSITNAYPPYLNPITGEWTFGVNVGAGQGAVQVFAGSTAILELNAYFSLPPRQAQFMRTLTMDSVNHAIAFPGEQISNPGAAASAITVGSYDWNDQFNGFSWYGACSNPPQAMQIGGLSCYSNPGYTRKGRIKPEIVAPGQYFTAAYAKQADGTGVNPEEWSRMIDKTGNFVMFNGTSAATPYTAGVIALMMQKRPTITSADIKSLFQKFGSATVSTGALPNPAWGYGKLDKDAVVSILNAL